MLMILPRIRADICQTATTRGGVLLSRLCPFLLKERKILAYFGQFDYSVANLRTFYIRVLQNCRSRPDILVKFFFHQLMHLTKNFEYAKQQGMADNWQGSVWFEISGH